MARILIVEDDGYHIFMIKKALAADGHEVCTYPSNSQAFTLTHLLAVEKMDLVLINRFLSRGNGWDIFNQLKERDHEINVMLYVLQECTLASVKWLSQSVDEALKGRQKKQRRPGFSEKQYSTENGLCPTLAIRPGSTCEGLTNL